MSEDDPLEPSGDPAWKARPFLNRPMPVVAPQTTAQNAPDDAVRPFLVTQGRTTGEATIAVEAQVQATARGMDARDTLSFEYRDIVALCNEPLAVAEIAARLRLHLGVTRVLLGDLKHQGMVTTFAPEVDLAGDIETIERVIHGLRQRF